jgi:hypothetical protein
MNDPQPPQGWAINKHIWNKMLNKKQIKKSPLGDLGVVSWQSWRAATRNPVEALKYE